MGRCAKCGTSTDGGQNYRFYFGVLVEEPEGGPAPAGRPLDVGPTFRAAGSEEVYYCDRCLVGAVAREDRVRSGFLLVLVSFALSTAVLLAWTSSPGMWAGLAAFLVAAALGGAAFLRYRRLHAALAAGDAVGLRELVRATPEIQNRGDEWAIARRQQELRVNGAEMFLTRREHEFWSRRASNPPA